MKESRMTQYRYTVHMTNFGMDKGTFDTVEKAIIHAKDLGFECAIMVSEVGKADRMHLCNVKPCGLSTLITKVP
jgi:hypothetical protein